jgi:hypothetical protein
MSSRVLAALAAAAALAVAGSANAATVFTAKMLGSNEVPANASSAVGFATVTIAGDSLMVQLHYEGLQGGQPAAAHIHCCIAPGSNVGVAVGFPSFPTTLTGTYSHTFDMTDPTIYTSGFLNTFGGGTAAGAEAALIAGLNAGQAYTNIHNRVWPGGEIRGFLTAAAVPEPATWALMILGFGLVGADVRRRRGAPAAA